jgi:hypothetical protein
MSTAKLPEYWLRGSVPDVPSLLQPVAHALLQAKDEVNGMMNDLPSALLWKKPAGMASAGFHIQHLAGVPERLFTYARGASLSPAQLEQLKAEGREIEDPSAVSFLVEKFNEQVNQCIEQLKKTDEATLTDTRYVGRAQLPSTVIGILFHAAEHTMRHVGQLLVTVQVVKAAELKASL